MICLLMLSSSFLFCFLLSAQLFLLLSLVFCQCLLLVLSIESMLLCELDYTLYHYYYYQYNICCAWWERCFCVVKEHTLYHVLVTNVQENEFTQTFPKGIKTNKEKPNQCGNMKDIFDLLTFTLFKKSGCRNSCHRWRGLFTTRLHITSQCSVFPSCESDL